MTESNHTPGPWEADGELIMSTQGIAVATVLYPDDFPCLEDAEGVEAECTANARLIAAAPDLLAALKMFVSAFPLPLRKDEAEAIKAGRTVIALVEGGN